jgi:hypothetical protein
MIDSFFSCERQQEGGTGTITKAKRLEIFLSTYWAASLVANDAHWFHLPFKITITKANHILHSRDTSKDNAS